MSTQPSNAVVELDQVDFAYQPGARRILSGLCMRVPKGSVVAVMGGSGCGKTTILRLIGGQVAAAAGTVRVHGQDIGAMDKRALYAARRQMGMLFQFGALFTDLSVFDNVAFPLREHTELPELLIRDLVLMKLNAVGLRGARDLMPSEISGGMARRVALASLWVGLATLTVIRSPQPVRSTSGRISSGASLGTEKMGVEGSDSLLKPQ